MATIATLHIGTMMEGSRTRRGKFEDELVGSADDGVGWTTFATVGLKQHLDQTVHAHRSQASYTGTHTATPSVGMDS